MSPYGARLAAACPEACYRNAAIAAQISAVSRAEAAGIADRFEDHVSADPEATRDADLAIARSDAPAPAADTVSAPRFEAVEAAAADGLPDVVLHDVAPQAATAAIPADSVAEPCAAPGGSAAEQSADRCGGSA
jgi:hypothetical protein